jgi:hypothetical protein
MRRLLPTHSPSQRLLAIELAVDLLKVGTGNSVQGFRRAGIDAAAMIRTRDQIRSIARNSAALHSALHALDDAQVLQIAYRIDCVRSGPLSGDELGQQVLQTAKAQERMLQLVGGLMRMHPRLAEIQ